MTGQLPILCARHNTICTRINTHCRCTINGLVTLYPHITKTKKHSSQQQKNKILNHWWTHNHSFRNTACCRSSCWMWQRAQTVTFNKLLLFQPSVH